MKLSNAHYTIRLSYTDNNGNGRTRYENTGDDYETACENTKYYRSHGYNAKLETYYTTD